LDRSLLAAFVDLVGDGTIADVGCGPGHVTRFLAALHADVVGIDLSPRMVGIARERAPNLQFAVGSMLALPVADRTWAGAIALYSIIHLTAQERAEAFQEFARAVRPGGWLLVAFHVESPDFRTGDVNHLTSWFGQAVDLDGYFLDPTEVASEVEAAGFQVMATVDRRPWPGIEYPSRRTYVLACRDE
jgi:SAM-dependent methyltransferase